MQRIHLLCIGSIKERFIEEGCKKYIGRLRDITLEVIELPASKEKDPRKQREEESKRLLKAMEGKEVWALDETGKNMSSIEFAESLAPFRDQGATLTFAIGGAYGLTPEILKASQNVISLGKMTLPHELCRLIFLEQLYRVQEIQKGSGYNH